MRKARFLMLLMVCVFMFSTSTLLAQDDSTLCFDLSADDCAMLESALANNATITSFNHSFNLDFVADGLTILELLGQPFPTATVFHAQGDGVFVASESASGLSFNGLSRGYQGELPENAPDSMTDLLGVLGVDTQDGDAFSFSLLNDDFYLLLNDENVSFPINALNTLELPLGLGDLLPLDAILTAELDNWGDITNALSLDELLMFDGVNMDAVVTYQRLDNQDLMGQTVAPFELRIDLGALINLPEFQPILTQELIAMTSQFDDPMFSLIIGFAPILFPGLESEIVMTQYVGTEDNLVHGIGFEFDFLIDLGMLTQPSDAPSGSSSIAPLDLSLDIELTMQDINSDITLTAPADARELSQTEVDRLLNGLLGE